MPEMTRWTINRDEPSESDIISTPSVIALSKALQTSDNKQPEAQQTLYTAILALGAMPRANPTAKPKNPDPGTGDPAAMDATCVPCPSESLGDRNSLTGLPDWPNQASYPPEKKRAPIILRLWSEKLGCSGQIPVSINPIIELDSEVFSIQGFGVSRPRNDGERVVWRCKTLSGNRERTPGSFRMLLTWSGVRVAEKPWIGAL
ncbi:hypothetical protein QQP08_025646 [Theobroma cacao]|nr:hypothetical protein QQP08_025646 [Theobroma cacao]